MYEADTTERVQKDVAVTLRVNTWTVLCYNTFQTKITARRYTVYAHKVWSSITEQKQVDRQKLIPLIASLCLTVF
jgi:hypothetical protein